MLAPVSSIAQPTWSSPFDTASETQDEDTNSTWSAVDSPAHSNPWGVGDDVDADDPWGTNERWDTNTPRGTGSDWSEDFYSFSDRSESSTSTRAGGGVMSNQASCESPGNPNNDACVEACSSDNPPSTCNSACETNPDGAACEAFEEFCEDNPNADGCNRFGTQDTQEVPVDGSLIYLLLAAAGYGGYKVRGL